MSNKIKCPVVFTFDLDAEPGMQSIRPKEEMFWTSQGQYGPRAAVPRILKLLDKYKIKATFCIVGKVAELYPDAINEIHSQGHEIAVHGYNHLPYIKLPLNKEKQEIKKTRDILEKITGKRPVGHRTPLWNPSEHTIALLEKWGFVWNSDFLNDDVPYFHEIKGRKSKLVEIPPSMSLNDWAQLIQFRESPRDMLDTWITEFNVLYKEGKSFILTLHPFDIGRPVRIVQLEKLIKHISKFKGAKFMKAIELANLFIKNKI